MPRRSSWHYSFLAKTRNEHKNKRCWEWKSERVRPCSVLEREALEHNTKMEEEPEVSRVRRLVILKEAMRAVSKSIGNDSVGQTQVDDLEDKLGVTIKFIRASEN